MFKRGIDSPIMTSWDVGGATRWASSSKLASAQLPVDFPPEVTRVWTESTGWTTKLLVN